MHNKTAELSDKLNLDSDSTNIVLKYDEITALIPHRYPFLLVDRVEKIIPGEQATGYKNVTINENFFQGHFPDFPIMPGVLIVEALAQTAGVLVCHTLDLKNQRRVYFMSIENARFRKPVTPGDVLELRVQKIQNRKTIWKFKGEALVDGVVYAEATFTAMIGVEG
ncbi:MAG: 3-hydroxyacyl-ACP dehydratase FabZ [Janthinobacterium lividum]